MGPSVRVLWLKGRRLCRWLANCANPVFTPPRRGADAARTPSGCVEEEREGDTSHGPGKKGGNEEMSCFLLQMSGPVFLQWTEMEAAPYTALYYCKVLSLLSRLPPGAEVMYSARKQAAVIRDLRVAICS